MICNFRLSKFIMTLVLLSGIVTAQDRVYFDIKTTFDEKTELLPVELGTTLVFSQSDWAGILELGEDYCIFMRNYRRKETRSAIYISLDIEMRKPGTFKAGDILGTRTIRLKINRDDTVSSATEFYNLIKSGFDISEDDYHNETIIIGKVVEKTAWTLYRSIQGNRTDFSNIIPARI
ncbi:hypothetical protein KJ762_10220 [bacterium]|nr:hypothetical protein [bacterium]MBU1063548.1 hypothetical protein [bacterium]MBU1634868.1 hypothetical protein [bacterium]MBU1872255.1 hypothetical protein [bacterium]